MAKHIASLDKILCISHAINNDQRCKLTSKGAIINKFDTQYFTLNEVFMPCCPAKRF